MPEDTLPPTPPDAPAPPPPPAPPPGGPQVNIEQEMRKSYLDYSMSVIIGRALPDVRDGLKPVHRRVLYAMHTEGLHHNKRYSKCAGVVGEVLKKYHPHGDASVYDALVRLAQDWNLRYPLIDGQGNFGSVDGDPAAAYRYTECRLERLSDHLLADIDKETVDWGPNFDESILEPRVLPTRFPNLLVNGSAGIAVGMATNIPPHNMGEVIDAAVHLIENPKATVLDLMRFIPGPDFPTAGFIHGRDGIRAAYEKGRGTIQVRARTVVEIHPKTERETIVVTEIPYQVNKAKLVEHIAELVREKRIEGISDLRDESSREGMRIVIELKRDAMAQVVLNNLYAHTQMQMGFGVIMLAIDGGQPRILTLKEMLERFVAHRRDVVTRRTRYELRKAREREHILLGYQIALDHIDEIIELIKKAKDRDAARDEMMARFALSELQAKAILEMQLQRLTGLERQKILDELAEVQKLITRLKEILASEKVLMDVIVGELKEVKQLFADERRTEIQGEASDLSTEDLIAEEEMVVTVSHLGYVKRNPVSLYRAQKRGGRGKTGAATRDEDFLESLFVASTHSYLLVFSDKGKVYWLKVHEIPPAGRTAKGKPIVNLVQLAPGEKVAAILPVRRLPEPPGAADEAAEGEGAEVEKAEEATPPGTPAFVFMVTRKGLIKKTRLEQFARPRAAGIIALGIEEGDELIAARLTDDRSHILLSTARGMAIRFEESDVRPMGRTAYGVKGITLEAGDEVVAGAAIPAAAEGEQAHTVLTVTANGYGKRTELAEYRVQTRGGKGLITIKTTERNGPVVAAAPVGDAEEVMLITNGGMLIRMPARGISVIGRNTQGVRLITLESKEEQVVGVARVAETTPEAEEAGVREEPEGAAPVETAPEDGGDAGDPSGEGGEGGEGPEEQG
ncbi:DNA gyrase, A subunit [Anaeromyxobacter dehalogenans 2CP-1]|uniref:DNA gyrase subunit A n=1 Tax=Anaeromyxobacter dehalogenans (strain ATCC BAA-258 / DSM 21875 / 2CP-1) TaxID=455488 RepID=B8JCU8_ANAD2|nr:DNA gyrase subunit A [Anaeromyxobacter dehalogenans]ACL67818.1 DNA gyrase, A subunit [Anaeromyxobacter dehalogenans 2CP-1]